jgi:molybdopterin converting factor small subunit
VEAVSTKVSIPMLLGNATEGAREVSVTGATLQECLDDLMRTYPLLGSHLFEADGALRRHVLILYNDQNTRWFDALDIPIQPGDRITILQAVSGG